jgi:hypothetical protein
MIEVYHEIERVARFFCAHCFDEHYFDLFKVDWKDEEDYLYIRFETRDKSWRLIDRVYQIKTFGQYNHLQKGVEVVALKRKQFEMLSSILTYTCDISEWEPFGGVEWVEQEKDYKVATLFDNGEIFLEVERFNYHDIAYVDTVDLGWKYTESVTKKEHFRNMKRFLFGSRYPFDQAEFFMSKEDVTKIKSALVWLIDNSKFDEKKGVSNLNDGI